MRQNERNSYSKTDHDATFMRMKKTIWETCINCSQVTTALPGVCDEYIAVYDVKQYAGYGFSPLMENSTEYMESILNIQLPTQAMEVLTTICTVKNTEWEIHEIWPCMKKKARILNTITIHTEQ